MLKRVVSIVALCAAVLGKFTQLFRARSWRAVLASVGALGMSVFGSSAFAQQGAIVVFVLCILIYCGYMNRLDRRHHNELKQLGAAD